MASQHVVQPRAAALAGQREAAEYGRRVDVEAGISASAFWTDVGDVGRHVHRQAAFERDVPRLDVTAIDVVDFRRVLGSRPIERYSPAAQVGADDARDALLERTVRSKLVVVQEGRRDRNRDIGKFSLSVGESEPACR